MNYFCVDIVHTTQYIHNFTFRSSTRYRPITDLFLDCKITVWELVWYIVVPIIDVYEYEYGVGHTDDSPLSIQTVNK